MQRIRRALIDLRRGEPVRVTGADNDHRLVIAVENLDRARLAAMTALAGDLPRLVMTHHRAQAMGLAWQSPAALSIPLRKNGAAPNLEAVVGVMKDPGKGNPPKPGTPAETTAIDMARHAGLLPVLLVVDPLPDAGDLQARVANDEILSVSVSEIEAFTTGRGNAPERISEARVPLEGAETSRFVLYREPDGLLEHIAVVIGEREQWPSPPGLRLHSACLTGDLFGSLRCDCGEQLRQAASTLAEEGGGVLLYLAQEGRGIGLANKLRAYGLQDTGMDTVDADQLLGFGEDERRYEIAAAILKDLGVASVRLMTNNPAKVSALEAAGIEIAGREAIHGQVNSHNARYLTAKAERSGHWLQELLTENRPEDQA